MLATMGSGKVAFTLICVVFSCFSFLLMSCDTDDDIQELRDARDQAEKRAVEVAEEPENTKRELEPLTEELWRQTPERVREYIKKLEKLVEKLPQATIKEVRLDRKKKDMDVYVRFNIKNRKNIECFVNGYFFQRRKKGEKFEKLIDENEKPISISEKFTAEHVTESRTVKFSISYAELHVTQPRELSIVFYIYDEATDSYLNTKPYSKLFRFDP